MIEIQIVYTDKTTEIWQKTTDVKWLNLNLLEQIINLRKVASINIIKKDK